MGYNIEVSFSVLKNSSIMNLLEEVKKCAEDNLCDYCYEDYEFENKVQFKRRHCLITAYFSHSNLSNMICFLNKIRQNKSLYIELVYDENNNSILYASQYFMTQKMDKYAAKQFRNQKRERSYSDDENMILNAISK